MIGSLIFPRKSSFLLTFLAQLLALPVAAYANGGLMLVAVSPVRSKTSQNRLEVRMLVNLITLLMPERLSVAGAS